MSLHPEVTAPHEVNGGAPPPPPPPADEGLSLLGALREERRTTYKATTEVFVIPGYEDKSTPLACRYGIIDIPTQRRLETRLAETPDDDDFREFNFWCDQLISACREFGVMQDEAFVPLPGAVRYDARLARGLGLDVPEPVRARSVLRAVFEREHGEWWERELLAHHTAVVDEWMRGRGKGGAQAAADEEFAGKS